MSSSRVRSANLARLTWLAYVAVPQLGISVSGTILFTRLRSALPPTSDAFPASSMDEILRGDFKSIALIEDLALRRQVRVALADSIRVIWYVVCPLIGLAFIVSLSFRPTFGFRVQVCGSLAD